MKQFGRAVGVSARKDGGQSNSQSGDMSQGIQIGCTVGIANPKPFLPRRLKAGVVAFTFGAQGISPLERERFPINKKAVVRRQSEILGTTPAIFAIVPVFVAARTAPGFR